MDAKHHGTCMAFFRNSHKMHVELKNAYTEILSYFPLTWSPPALPAPFARLAMRPARAAGGPPGGRLEVAALRSRKRKAPGGGGGAPSRRRRSPRGCVPTATCGRAARLRSRPRLVARPPSPPTPSGRTCRIIAPSRFLIALFWPPYWEESERDSVGLRN